MSYRHSLLRAAIAASVTVGLPALAQVPGPGAPPAAPGPAGSPSTSASGVSLLEPPERMLGDLTIVADSAGGLTADRAAQRAVEASPTMEARRAAAEASEAKVREVVGQFLPRLSVSATYTRLSSAPVALGGALVGAGAEGTLSVDGASGLVVDSAGNPVGAASFQIPNILNSYDLTAKVLVPLSDYLLRLPGAKAAAESLARSKELAVEVAERDVALDAREAYYQWVGGVAAVSIASASVERTKALVKDAEHSFALGAATKSDVLRLEAAVASTEVTLARAEQLRELTRERLATLLADPPSTQYGIGEAPRLGIVDDGPLASAELEPLITQALRERVELEALRAAERSLIEGEKAVQRGRLPRLDAFGSATMANPNQRFSFNGEEWNGSWAVGLSLSYSLTDTIVGGAQAAQISAQHAELLAQVTEAERGIRLQVTDAKLELQRAQKAVEAAERSYAAAEEGYRVGRALFRVGRATATDLLNAEDELLRSSLARVTAALDQRVAAIKLEYAIGGPPDGSP